MQTSRRGRGYVLGNQPPLLLARCGVGVFSGSGRASEYRARRYFDVAAHVCAHVIPAPHPHANIEAWTRVCPRQPTTPLPCSMWSGSSFPEAGGRRSIGRDGTSIHVMGGRAKERGRAYLGVRRSWSVFGAFLGSPVGSPVVFLGSPVGRLSYGISNKNDWTVGSTWV